MADFRMLGPVEVWIGDRQLDIGPPQQRHVLAVLMFSPGQPVSVAALVEQVWGDSPPAQARNALYSYVARLRKVLRPHASVGGEVRRTQAGYMLDVETEAVDSHRFRRRLTRARDPATSDEERRSLLHAALGEWRGNPLTGLGGEWADNVRHGLEQQRINAFTTLVDIEFDRGDYLSTIDQINDFVAEYPLSEALTGRLMRALRLAGRNAEALTCYARFRQRIVSDLGAEPGPDLRRIHGEILRATAAPEALGELTPPAGPAWRGLQPHLATLIGRGDEQSRLFRLLAHERLVTVTGAGGCGKTALALRVAHDFVHRHGIAGAALTLVGTTSTDQITSGLGALLSDADEGADPMPAIQRTLAAKRWLLLLDNCEHVAADVADLAVRLLGGCPELTILTTSRQPLGVTGEVVLTLSPLAVPLAGRPADLSAPAAELFVQRARQAQESIVISPDDFEDVGTICRRLDGLPLALELVAARVRTFTLHDLADRLGSDLTLLFRGGTGGDVRHHTLDSTLDWSFRLLSPGQQCLFARLATFAGGFTAKAAEATCGFAPLDGAEVAAMLAALVDRSLVQPYDRAGTRRYQLLELVRIFAARRLAERGERAECMHRQLDFRLAEARRIDQIPRYHDRVLSWQAMEADAANLRGCLVFGFAEGRPLDAAEIIARMFEFWLVSHGYLAEGRTMLDRALRISGLAERPEVLALLRFHRALLVSIQGDRLRSLALMRDVIDDLCLHRPRECLEGRAALLNAKGSLLDPSALDEVAPAVSLALGSESVDDARIILNAARWVLITWGRYDDAAALHTAVDRLGPVPDPASAAAVLTLQVLAALGRADLASARAMIDELHGMLPEISHAAEHDDPRRAIALTYLCGDEVDRAVRFLSESWSFLQAGYPQLARRFVSLRILLAEAHRRAGDLPAAVATLCAALETSAGSSDFAQSFTGVLAAALVADGLGDDTASRMLAADWDALRRQLGLPVPVGFERPAADLLGLAPAPHVRPAGGYTWDLPALETCVADARDWCRRQPAADAARLGCAGSTR